MAQETADFSETTMLRLLLDRQEIQDVISRYALGQDRHQGEDSGVLEDWHDVFTSDAVTDYSAAGAPVGSYVARC